MNEENFKKFVSNGIEFEYDEVLLDKIREYLEKDKNYEVIQEDIVNFFKNSLKSAIEKGYGIVEE